MRYRNFGKKVKWRPSALGFGAMRLPTVKDDRTQIDEEKATRMLYHAIDNGVNYVDTAYPYHGGNSEKFLGRVLEGKYRERVKLATKLPSWDVKDRSDMDRIFNEQLDRLRTDRVDFYLLHGLDEGHWNRLKEMKVLDWAERMMADGRFGHLGFSFHDSVDVFKRIIDSYDWSFCQIQYNFMDEEYQAGTEGLRYAADRGIAVVVMEPIRGGMLSRRPPKPILDLWEESSIIRSPAEWALQWVWNHPEVSVVLSGMTEMAHVEENLSSADRSGAKSLSRDELDLVALVRDKYRELAPIPCTQCKYCLPCPNGVDIPRVLSIFNDAIMYNDMGIPRGAYAWMKDENKADVCVACGDCEELCPQSIEIIDSLAKAHQLLSGT